MTLVTTRILSLVGAATLSLGCAAGPGGGGGGKGQGAGLVAASGEAPTSEVEADLVFMREEEKLARDVYAAFADVDSVFVNIGAAEQRHMDAVGQLLSRYALPDPTAGKAAGEFSDPALQALYDSLIEKGSASRVAALTVGAEIEEVDLVDLAAALEGTTMADVRQVFENLSRASRNHLRAFHDALGAEGVDYTPVHLDAADYDAIVSSGRERGGGMGDGRGGH